MFMSVIFASLPRYCRIYDTVSTLTRWLPVVLASLASRASGSEALNCIQAYTSALKKNNIELMVDRKS